ncbi:hypothetical protein BKA62DRAFT_34816 [Auriculariales sp. MPI-PUGE-AT-0066]|nr:hypothetical protein BKA62DRAFT_34816 [Auriculariales sp. MPI-PUGE-AT-0066]
MVSLRSLAAGLVALPLASAMIAGVAPFTGTYQPTANSTFPVTFTAGGTKVVYFDLSVSFGLLTPADLATSNNNALGVPLQKTLDMFALNATNIFSQTTFDVPLPQSYFYNGPGDYILSALVSGVNGVNPTLVPFHYILQLPFTASF